MDLQSTGFKVPELQTIADQEAADHQQRTPQLPDSLTKLPAKSHPPESAVKPPAAVIPAKAAFPAPVAAAPPASLSASEQALQHQLEVMAAQFAKQLAAMQAQLQSTPPLAKLTAPAPAQQSIDIDEEVTTSPMKDLNFDPFHIVKQFSPAVAGEANIDRNDLQSACQALFARHEVMQTTKWSEVLTWSLQSPADRARSPDEYEALS